MESFKSRYVQSRSAYFSFHSFFFVWICNSSLFLSLPRLYFLRWIMLSWLGPNVLRCSKTYESQLSISHLIGMFIVLTREKVSCWCYVWFLTCYSLIGSHQLTLTTWKPTALELSQSPLLPSRLKDKYLKGALRMMGWFLCSLSCSF